MKKIFKKIKEWFCKVISKFGNWLLKISGNDIYNKPIEIKVDTKPIVTLENSILIPEGIVFSEDDAKKQLVNEMLDLIICYMVITANYDPISMRTKIKGRLELLNTLYGKTPEDIFGDADGE